MAESVQKLVTGNRLRDGVPVYFAGGGKWSPAVSGALLVDPAAAEDLLAEAQKIRAFGPTVSFGAVPHG